MTFYLFSDQNLAIALLTTHRSGLTKSYLKSEKIELLEDWLTQLPDINPIEDSWGWMAKKINLRVFNNMNELKDGFFRLWDEMPIFLVQIFISRLDKKHQYIIATNGDLWSEKKGKDFHLA